MTNDETELYHLLKQRHLWQPYEGGAAKELEGIAAAHARVDALMQKLGVTDAKQFLADRKIQRAD